MSAPALPVGPPVDATPAQLPGPGSLKGRYGSVERLSAVKHGPDLWDAVRGHDDVWTYMGYGPFSATGPFSTCLPSARLSKTRTITPSPTWTAAPSVYRR
jgi:hypothetical protein